MEHLIDILTVLAALAWAWYAYACGMVNAHIVDDDDPRPERFRTMRYYATGTVVTMAVIWMLAWVPIIGYHLDDRLLDGVGYPLWMGLPLAMVGTGLLFVVFPDVWWGSRRTPERWVRRRVGAFAVLTGGLALTALMLIRFASAVMTRDSSIG